MPLFVPLVIYYCCSLIVAPHRFLQVRRNYIRCIFWYIVCVVFFPHQSGIRALGWAIFTCLNDGGSCFEWYKLSFVEGQDERFIICQEIASFGLLLHRSQIICLKKNGTLSTNRFVVYSTIC